MQFLIPDGAPDAFGDAFGGVFDEAFDEHRAVLEHATGALREPFGRLVGLAVGAVRAGGKIIFFGNGGSAADAQHLATELVVRFVRNRDPIAALALTTDSSALTAIGNDLGFDALFSRQIAALGSERDLAIAISTPGNSENVLQGARQAKSHGMPVAALTGRTGGKLRDLADPLLAVPSETTARIQEIHILIGHALCDALERELF
jgi:D-sedoheptulose 7-phosphate isomerase